MVAIDREHLAFVFTGHVHFAVCRVYTDAFRLSRYLYFAARLAGIEIDNFAPVSVDSGNGTSGLRAENVDTGLVVVNNYAAIGSPSIGVRSDSRIGASGTVETRLTSRPNTRDRI